MPKKTNFDHIIWTGKGAGGHYDHERRELGIDRDVTLKGGIPVPVGDGPGEVPPAFAERLVEAGKAAYCSASGKTVETDDSDVRTAVKESVARAEAAATTIDSEPGDDGSSQLATLPSASDTPAEGMQQEG